MLWVHSKLQLLQDLENEREREWRGPQVVQLLSQVRAAREGAERQQYVQNWQQCVWKGVN